MLVGWTEQRREEWAALAGHHLPRALRDPDHSIPPTEESLQFYLLAGQNTALITELATYNLPIAQTVASSKRYLRVLNEAPLVDTPSKVDAGAPLELRDVSFTYAGAPINALPVLSDLSISVQPGHMVLVMGDTGSGKTSLLLALLLFLGFCASVPMWPLELRCTILPRATAC